MSLNLISRVSTSSHQPPQHLPCREVKLSVVSYLTNSIVDQILQELYATHKTLVNTLLAPDSGLLTDKVPCR